MLQVRDICKSYGSLTVLSGAELELAPGACVGLAGKNGSGKSTLLRIIAQIERPDRGAVLYGGENVLGDRGFVRRHIGYVPQSDSLAPFLTVGRQLELWRAAVGAADSESAELMGLDELMGRRVSDLSGGQKKRVSIAMALQNRPDILVVDEGFAALDAGYRERVARWLPEYTAAGGAVLWCSHEPGELVRLCRSCYVLRGGRTELMSAAEAAGFLSGPLDGTER